MPNNKNNFIRFTGAFVSPDFSISIVGFPSVNFYPSYDSLTYNVGSALTASLGVNLLSLKILSVKDSLGNDVLLSQDCYYDGAGNITVYRPIDLTLLSYSVFFNFQDYAGNVSFNEVITINFVSILTAWVVYPASAICNLDGFGNNNGYLYCEQLKLINQSTGSDIVPLTLKPNVPSDADYIAPITDYVACPVVSVGTYAPLIIGNFSRNGSDPTNFITITGVYLASTNLGPGATPIALNMSCSIAPGQTQRFNVPAGAWDTGLTISYSVTGTMSGPTTRFWLANNAGAVTGWPTPGAAVDNSGTYGNFTITIPPNSTGMVIYAQ